MTGARTEAKQAALRRAVRTLRTARRWRSRLYERCGSARYSRTALYNLDRMLEPYLPDGGVFVEAGANDGFRQSNTYYLERFRGWTGVLIEPVPALAATCAKNRPRSRVCQCALVGPDHPTADVVVTCADMFSEIVVEGGDRPHTAWGWDDVYDVTVPARTLSEILGDAAVDHVDFISLDVQGVEAAALAGLDLDRWTPATMLIEILDDKAQNAVEAVLGSRYERVARVTPHDVLYRAVTRARTA